jgi:hypothetical protein
LPADVGQQAEVFAELDPELLGFGEVLLLLQCVPKIAHRAEVIADQLVEPVALVAVDRRGDFGHGAPPSGRGTEEPPFSRAADLPEQPKCSGRIGRASKDVSSVPGPGAFERRRGRYVLRSATVPLLAHESESEIDVDRR